MGSGVSNLTDTIGLTNVKQQKRAARQQAQRSAQIQADTDARLRDEEAKQAKSRKAAISAKQTSAQARRKKRQGGILPFIPSKLGADDTNGRPTLLGG